MKWPLAIPCPSRHRLLPVSHHSLLLSSSFCNYSASSSKVYLFFPFIIFLSQTLSSSPFFSVTSLLRHLSSLLPLLLTILIASLLPLLPLSPFLFTSFIVIISTLIYPPADTVPHAAGSHRSRTASSPIPYALGTGMPPGGGASRPMSPAGSLSTSIPKTGAALMEASMGRRF